jgi:hypothetical protein
MSSVPPAISTGTRIFGSWPATPLTPCVHRRCLAVQKFNRQLRARRYHDLAELPVKRFGDGRFEKAGTTNAGPAR